MVSLIFTCILLTQVISKTVLPENPESCLTPNGEIAYCISIYKCELFIKALKNRTEKETKRFLRESQCDYEKIPFVCCGSSTEYEFPQGSGLAVRAADTVNQNVESLNQDLLNKYGSSLSKHDCSTRYVTIHDGRKAQISQYPWTALLEYRKNGTTSGYHCGGSLISEGYILTAAHCLIGDHRSNFGEVYRVRLGEFDRSKEKSCEDSFCDENKPGNFYIKEWTIHPNFNVTEPTLNDIALIKLGKNVTFNGVIGPVCLPEVDNPYLYESSLEITGWAISGNCNGTSEKLREKISLSKQRDCSFYFTLNESQLCVDKNTRIGDSGGGLIAHGTILEGIDSLRMEDCNGDDSVPVLYTRVYSFMPWILENLKP